MATTNTNSFPLSEIVDCPQCQKQITVYDPEGSEYLTCPACNNYLHYTSSGKLDIVRSSLNAPSSPPTLPIGTLGTLKGDEFKVIAYLEKKESGAAYAWREYILYNFTKGYATLAEYDGHWNFVKGKNFFPDLANLSKRFYRTTSYNQIDFKVFNKYSSKITAMIGEVDWDVVGENTATTELIAPPFMLFREEVKGTISYYLGEYISNTEIATAFNIEKKNFPDPIGVGANQPSKFAEKWDPLFTFTGIAIVCVLLLHLLIWIIKPEKELLNHEFKLTNASGTVDSAGLAIAASGNQSFELKPFITPSFILDDETANIEFAINSNVSNNWLEATIVLVNEKDNKTWEVTKGIEHYNGYDGGESWSEGSTTAEIMLSNIPAGKYHLNVYSVTGDAQRDSLSIQATANSSLWRNTLLTSLLLCLYPFYCWIRMRTFEKKRWNNSNYSPFVS